MINKTSLFFAAITITLPHVFKAAEPTQLALHSGNKPAAVNSPRVPNGNGNVTVSAQEKRRVFNTSTTSSSTLDRLDVVMQALLTSQGTLGTRLTQELQQFLQQQLQQHFQQLQKQQHEQHQAIMDRLNKLESDRKAAHTSALTKIEAEVMKISGAIDGMHTTMTNLVREQERTYSAISAAHRRLDGAGFEISRTRGTTPQACPAAPDPMGSSQLHAVAAAAATHAVASMAAVNATQHLYSQPAPTPLMSYPQLPYAAVPPASCVPTYPSGMTYNTATTSMPYMMPPYTG